MITSILSLEHRNALVLGSIRFLSPYTGGRTAIRSSRVLTSDVWHTGGLCPQKHCDFTASFACCHKRTLSALYSIDLLQPLSIFYSVARQCEIDGRSELHQHRALVGSGTEKKLEFADISHSHQTQNSNALYCAFSFHSAF